MRASYETRNYQEKSHVYPGASLGEQIEVATADNAGRSKLSALWIISQYPPY